MKFMKRVLLASIGTGLSIVASGEELLASEKSFRQDPFNHPDFPFFLMAALGIIVIVLVIVVVSYAFNIVKFLKGMEDKHIRYNSDTSGRKSTVQEYQWYLYGACALIVVILVPAVSVNFLSTPEKKTIATIGQEPVEAKAIIDENTIEYTHDAAIIARGKKLFENTTCGACHGNDGAGTVGPNLTDEYWIHGGDIKNIYLTIKKGVPDKGMPSWEKALKPEQVRDVAFYILSLQGTNPPNAKFPQGEKQLITVNSKSIGAREQATLK
jgi:cytochrome c oxidase cbb3-type subunit III